jgi:hypothetical protein
MAGNTHKPLAQGLPARRAAVVSCWMCGIRQNPDQMVPDGGSACADIRWYCQDTRACTERWAPAGRQARAAGVASPGNAIAAHTVQAPKPAAAGSAAPAITER